MAQIVTRFGDVYSTAEVLPLYAGRQPQGAGDVGSSLVQIPGGVFDYRGSDDAAPEAERSDIVGEWIAATASEVEAKVRALRALRGVRSRLWRVDASSNQQWRWARCLRVQSEVEPGALTVASFRLTFELFPMPWSGTDRSNSVTLSSSPQNVSLTNSGDAYVRDAVLTLTAGSAAITQVDFVVSGVVAMRWTGTIGVGQSLVIDCGKRTVLLAGADAYSGFSLESGHAIGDWLRLAKGGNTTLVVTRSGGSTNSTLAWEYADAWV